MIQHRHRLMYGGACAVNMFRPKVCSGELAYEGGGR